MPELPSVGPAVVLLADRASGAGVWSRVAGSGRRLSGAGFDAVVGRLGKASVVAVAPTKQPADFASIVKAMRDAYRPAVIVGVGFSTAVGAEHGAGRAILATCVLDADGVSHRFSPAEPTRQLLAGAVACEQLSAPPSDALAANEWCVGFVRACEEHTQPAALVTVIAEDPKATQGEVTAVLNRRSLAGRAGALLRAAWRRPSSVLDLAGWQARRLEHQETLANAVEQLLNS